NPFARRARLLILNRTPAAWACLRCSSRTSLRRFLFPIGIETEGLDPRNLDTTYRYPYRYELRPDNRLESVANAHTAADLHVRPVSKTALVSGSWRCEQI